MSRGLACHCPGARGGLYRSSTVSWRAIRRAEGARYVEVICLNCGAQWQTAASYTQRLTTATVADMAKARASASRREHSARKCAACGSAGPSVYRSGLAYCDNGTCAPRVRECQRCAGTGNICPRCQCSPTACEYRHERAACGDCKGTGTVPVPLRVD